MEVSNTNDSLPSKDLKSESLNGVQLDDNNMPINLKSDLGEDKKENAPVADKTSSKKNKDTDDAELTALWKSVHGNQDEFNAWTNLLDFVEKQDKRENIRAAYDEFLCHYPYCYGYWKKYAEMERRQGSADLCFQKYEAGVAAIPLSADIWIAYLDFALEIYQPDDEYISKMRSLYERAVASAGLDFRSDKLWEHYIGWESILGHLREATALYDRLLATPTQLYYQNWENFKRHMEDHDPAETIAEAEFLELKLSIFEEQGKDATSELSETDVVKVREKFIDKRDVDIYQNTYKEITKRWYFEEKIRRPYFHARPLEQSQLTNWAEYITFEINEGDASRVQTLFERCLIACALYEHIWIRYVKYMESTLGDIAGARAILRRACCIHLARKSTLHWLWACFEERHPEPGQEDAAMQIMTALEQRVPTNAMVAVRRADLMRRKNVTNTEVISYLEEAIQRFSGYDDMDSVCLLVSKLVRYLHRVMNAEDRAIQVLREAVNRDPRNERLFGVWLDIVYQRQPSDVEGFCEVVSMATESSLLPGRAKVSICRRKVQFLEEFDADIHRLSSAYEELEALRAAVEDHSNMDDESAPKRAKYDAEDQSVASAMQLCTSGPYDPLVGVQPMESVSTTTAATSVTPVSTDAYQTQTTGYQQQYGYTNPWDQYSNYYYGAYNYPSTDAAPIPPPPPPPVPSAAR